MLKPKRLINNNSLLRNLYSLWDSLKGNPKFQPELNAVSFICPLNSVALDIGSLHGIFIRPMLRYASNVIAYEPNPKKFKHIKQTHISNPLVKVINCAVSDNDGVATLMIPFEKGVKREGWATIDKLNFDDNRDYEKIDVNTVCLDNEQHKNVGLVKIDVEGHELSVLDGGKLFFEKELPIVIIESENRHHPGAPEKVISFFKNLKYSGYFILGRKVIDINEFDSNIYQDIDSIDFNTSLLNQNYAYNFIFISPKYKHIKLPSEL